MYRMMVRARAFDTKAVNLQRTGKLGTYPSCLGHEATHVGVGAAMRPDDVLFTVYREIGTKFWRGVDMLDILLYWGGDERGTMYRHSPQDFPFCVPIGSQMPHAAGAALAIQIRDERRCALAFIGDGGTSQGAFLRGDQLRRRQVAAAGMRHRQQPLGDIGAGGGTDRGRRHWRRRRSPPAFRRCRSTGNDLLVVRDVVGDAVERARGGGGPTVIEALTYRLSDHTTSDDATRYRSGRGGRRRAAAGTDRTYPQLPAIACAVGRGRRAGAQGRMQRGSRRRSQAVPGDAETIYRRNVRLSVRAADAGAARPAR